MSGHNKWSTIQQKKGVKDAKRGQIFTKYIKLITMAAKERGGDMKMNSTLRMLVAKAKKDNLPMEKIERAIKIGTGEIKSDVAIQEVLYEGYGPSGVALLIQVLTDNTNRAFASVRTILTKAGATLGKPGCVEYLFNKKGIFVFENVDTNALEEFAILNGAEDIVNENSVMIVYTHPQDFHAFSEALSQSSFVPTHFELSYVPNTFVEGDEKIAEKIEHLVDLLEEDDDVHNVITNLKTSS